MKNFVVISILILAFCVVSFGQTDQNSKCPSVSITGPAGVVNPSETGIFTAIVDGEQREQYIYRWTITGATIVEEDGKDVGAEFEEVGKNRIRFQISPEMAGSSLMGTVEIKGLPEGCPNTASESMIFCGLQTATEVDEFSISVTQIAKAKLNNLAVELQNNPSAQIYIIERFERKISRKTIEQKNQKIIDYLKTSGMDVSRFTLITSYSEKNLTQIFLVPAGAAAPTCDDCEDLRSK